MKYLVARYEQKLVVIVVDNLNFVGDKFESCQGVCGGHVTVYVKEAMESGEYVWAAAPSSNPG
eukprot:15347562-Ditylum_brightwellii.AAC.1